MMPGQQPLVFAALMLALRAPMQQVLAVPVVGGLAGSRRLS